MTNSNSSRAIFLVEMLVQLEQSSGWAELKKEIQRDINAAEDMAFDVKGLGSELVYSKRDLACLEVVILKKLLNMPESIRRKYQNPPTSEGGMKSNVDIFDEGSNPDPYER